MRSTVSAPDGVRYELRDREGRLLAETRSYAEATRTLRAFVLTSPGREDDVSLIILTDQREIARQDVFDIEFGGTGNPSDEAGPGFEPAT